MYDTEKLFRLLKRDLNIYSIARDVLDYMLFIEKTHNIELSRILTYVERADEPVINKVMKRAPEFITLGVDETGRYVLSKILKQHFNSKAFREQINRNREIDASRLDKDNSSYTEASIVMNVDFDILRQPYLGMLPTKNYIRSREVFTVSEGYFHKLVKMFPSKDIDAELKLMYEYFIDNPHARREPKSLRAFINRWISGDLIKNAKKSRSYYTLSAKSFYEELRKNGI